MTKLLTTGEMIDTLKVGEVVEGVIGGSYSGTRLRMTDHHEIVYVRGKSNVRNNFFELSSFSHNAKWCILPNYVSFDEAMEAFYEGKTITMGAFSFCISNPHSLCGLELTDIHSDNWMIESA